MRTAALAAGLAFAALLGGCASKPYDFTDFNRVAPRSILVVPPANRSLEVEASSYMLSTLTIPLAELGYYVFPVNTVKMLLEQEGLYEPERVREMGAARLANLFGADAVLFITIKRWEAAYAILSTTVTVDLEYELAGKDGGRIWHASKAMQYSPQQQQQSSLAAQLIVAAIQAAATRAKPDYLPLARQANQRVLLIENTKLPPGPYAREK